MERRESRPLTRRKAAEGLERKFDEKRQRTMFQPRKVIGPRDIVVNNRNPCKIKIEADFGIRIKEEPLEISNTLDDIQQQVYFVKDEIDLPMDCENQAEYFISGPSHVEGSCSEETALLKDAQRKEEQLEKVIEVRDQKVGNEWEESTKELGTKDLKIQELNEQLNFDEQISKVGMDQASREQSGKINDHVLPVDGTVAVATKMIDNSALELISAAPISTGLDYGRIAVSVRQWRDYLSKLVFQNPEVLITNQNVDQLIARISRKKEPMSKKDHERLNNLLKRLNLNLSPDGCSKAAVLLRAFLEPGRPKLKAMEHIICYRCNTLGHWAVFCFREMSKEEECEARRAFRKRPESKRQVAERNKRRRLENYYKDNAL